MQFNLNKNTLITALLVLVLIQMIVVIVEVGVDQIHLLWVLGVQMTVVLLGLVRMMLVVLI